MEEALKIYQDLVAEEQGIAEVVAILTENLARYADNIMIYEVLADAQVHNGQLNKALELYQHALEKLQ